MTGGRAGALESLCGTLLQSQHFADPIFSWQEVLLLDLEQGAHFYCSVAQSCLTLWDPMEEVHYLLKNALSSLPSLLSALYEAAQI